MYLGRFDDAAASFRETIRAGVSDANINGAKGHLAQVLMHQNKLDEASALYDQLRVVCES